MSKERLVTIIVPVYRVEKYLERCIISIINQTYHNLEIVLVDDGSPDACPEICDRWKKKDKRIIVIHKENEGLSAARNDGMKIATGEYVAFIDSDDWIDQNWVEVLIKEIMINDAEIAIGATRLVNEKNQTLLIRGNICATYTKQKALIELINGRNVYPTACDKIYRRELIDNIPFKIGKINEDEYWTWKILLKSSKIICCNSVNYNYYQNSGSIMGSKYTIRRLDGLDARVERFLELKKYDDLKLLCNQTLISDCMYHMQCACAFLDKKERNIAIEYIKSVIMLIDFNIVEYNNIKTYFWNTLFRYFPLLTSIIRNKLGVGF